jgi:hypothetical protein
MQPQGEPITDPQNQSSYTTASPISIADTGTGDINFNQRILPRQLSSGALRGTQTVGYGGVQIDGSNNRIVIGSTTDTLGEQAQTIIGRFNPTNPHDQSFGISVTDANGTTVTFGLLADGSPGMSITDGSGFQLFKLSGLQWDWFDKNYNTNTMRAGLMPDGNYGWVTVPPQNNVKDAF